MSRETTITIVQAASIDDIKAISAIFRQYHDNK